MTLLLLAGLVGCGASLGENQSDASRDMESESQESESQNSGSLHQDGAESDALTCTISIECTSILDHMDDLDQAKTAFVPADGWILKPTVAVCAEGDTVFDVLKSVCREAGIQMESSYTPLYDSYYVEGIHQLYELDCGSDSGWTYWVNGIYPNYGCSEYTVRDGDTIEWKYTRDLGVDVGGEPF